MTTTKDRIPGQDLLVEESVLGQVLLHRDAMDLYASYGCTSDLFHKYAHRLIWSAASRLHAGGHPVDLVTTKTELERTGAISEVTVSYLSRLIDGKPRPRADWAEWAIGRLRQCEKIRLGVQAFQQIQDEMRSHDPDLESMASTLQDIVDAFRTTEPLFWATAEDQIAKAQLAISNERPRLKLGLPGIDQWMKGQRQGEVLGLMGRPGLGKTMLFCHMIRAALQQDWAVLLFTLEMPMPQIVERLLRMEIQRSREDIANDYAEGTLDWTPYRTRYGKLGIVEEPALTVPQMAARTARYVSVVQRPTVVLIDHMGLIGGDRKLSTYDRVSLQARDLKELAKRQDVAVQIAIQVGRETGGDGDQRLSLGSARDSGVIEEVVDQLLCMRRLDRSRTLTDQEKLTWRDILLLELIKNRHESPSPHEVCYELSPSSLRVEENLDLRPPSGKTSSRLWGRNK